MAITKEIQIGKIEVVAPHRSVEVRTDTVVMEDGTELSRSYHRHVLHPNVNISAENSEVQAVCNAVWTDQVKSDYETFLATPNNQNPV
jgi:hypothetical protein|tara:strand:- start:174 stop:437 length:264 start_codon:yes stop_codon:yes gene_type:complete